MGAFVNNYLDVFNRGFQYAFMAAIVAMLISLVIYLVNKNRFPDPAKKVVAAKEQNATVSKEEIKMSAAEIKQRILCPVRSVRCGNLLLAVVPPERLFADLLCTRLCRLERNRY